MLLLVVSDPRWLSFPLFADVLPIRTDVHLVISNAHLCRNAQHHEIFKVGSNPVWPRNINASLSSLFWENSLIHSNSKKLAFRVKISA